MCNFLRFMTLKATAAYYRAGEIAAKKCCYHGGNTYGGGGHHPEPVWHTRPGERLVQVWYTSRGSGGVYVCYALALHFDSSILHWFVELSDCLNLHPTIYNYTTLSRVHRIHRIHTAVIFVLLILTKYTKEHGVHYDPTQQISLLRTGTAVPYCCTRRNRYLPLIRRYGGDSTLKGAIVLRKPRPVQHSPLYSTSKYFLLMFHNINT